MMSVLGLSFSRRLHAGVKASQRGRFLVLAVLACGLASVCVTPNANAAFVSGLPAKVKLDNYDPAILVNSWFNYDYDCKSGACNDTNVQDEIEELLDYETVEYLRIDYDPSNTGQTEWFTYEGLARTIFAIKGGQSTMAVLVFDRAITGWSIKGLPTDVSNVSGVNPIPLPPAALLFLSGLAGMVLLARRRRAKPARAAAL